MHRGKPMMETRFLSFLSLTAKRLRFVSNSMRVVPLLLFIKLLARDLGLLPFHGNKKSYSYYSLFDLKFSHSNRNKIYTWCRCSCYYVNGFLRWCRNKLVCITVGSPVERPRVGNHGDHWAAKLASCGSGRWCRFCAVLAQNLVKLWE